MIVGDFWRLVPWKTKTPPANPSNTIKIPEITMLNSKPIVKGVNIPERSAAATIM